MKMCLSAAVLSSFSNLFIDLGEAPSNIFSSFLLSHLFFLSFLCPLCCFECIIGPSLLESLRTFVSFQCWSSFRCSVILIEFQQWKSKTILFCLHQNPCPSVIRIKCATRWKNNLLFYYFITNDIVNQSIFFKDIWCGTRCTSGSGS